jgi:hypothetical protein
MRTLVVPVVLLAAAFASAAGADRGVTSPGPVRALARSGSSVAYLSGPYERHCGPHVELWSLGTGGVYRLGRHTDAFCSEGPSTGSGVTDISVAGNRALWLAYTGGNLRDWVLETATTTRPAERRLEFREVGVDAPAPIVLGVASEQVMPYSIGATVKVLRADGARLYAWRAPARVTNTTAYNAMVAAFVAGGNCYVLAPTGAVLQKYTFPPDSVLEFALSGAGLVVQLSRGKVEIHRGAATVRRLTLPTGARMLDYAEGILLYKLGQQIRARRVSTGKDALLRTATFAMLEHNGLSYAARRHVSSVAMVNVQAAIRAG